MNNKEYFKWIMPSIKNRTVRFALDKEYNFRVEKAREQQSLSTVDKGEIVKYVNQFLADIMGMDTTDNPYVKPRKTEKRRINYSIINLENKEDIVWIKFTKTGFISVIGTGCDIYFTDYAKENTTAGLINRSLNEEWDDTIVLIFPLKNIPKGLNRSDIESGIGNYLILQGVPILDFYSHNY